MFFNLTNKEIKETVYFDIEAEAKGFIKGLRQILPATHRVDMVGEPLRWVRHGKICIRMDYVVSPIESN